MRLPLIVFFLFTLYKSYSQNDYSFDVSGFSIGVVFNYDTIRVGTGFVMGKNNWVITCSHVEYLNPGPKSFQNIGSGKKYPITPLADSRVGDIIIYTAGSPLSPKPLVMDTSFKFTPTKDIIYLGYDEIESTNKSSKIKSCTSIIEAVGYVTVGELNTTFIEFIGEGIPGYSGGPVFNTDGKVIGIFAESYFRKGLHGDESPIQLINRAFTIQPIYDYIKKTKQ